MTDAIVIEKGEDLSNWLANPVNEGQIVQTRLAASDRVIARVTDGIYRQPASALRELISNAWDADASTVTILTDAPRFSRIYVRDDGAGMSHETLTRLLKNIGGSAKRREEGKSLGVVSAEDVDCTPGGRPLIGKIGIGLFSISQLSRRFQISTKARGENYRLLAEIRLRAYAEDRSDVEADEGEDYIAGDVLIRRERTDDLEAHGTDIILDDVKPRVRDILRSADRWDSVADREAAFKRGDLDTWASMRVEPPTYHSGYIGNLSEPADGPVLLAIKPKLPWTSEDPADIRMSKLMDAVEGEFDRLDRPELATTLDTYLEMIWTLGLAAPVAYVDRHPFDLTQDGHLQLYWITRERGRGQEVRLNPGITVREAVKAQIKGAPALTDGLDPVGGFRVVMDGVELKRPIRFKHYATTQRGLNTSVLFVGRFEPDLTRVAQSQRGGDLSLEAYLFWTGRVVPKENNGVLVRIRGASGSNFDPNFFKYQVSEQTRLRQITSELFVQRGLDAALNIDRESFNYSHPHLQLVTLWLHGAIRQLTNRLKDEADRLRALRKQSDAQAGRDHLATTASEIWRKRRGDEPAPDVVIANTASEAQEARKAGSIAIMRSGVPQPAKPQDRAIYDGQAAALIQVLAAYDVLEGRTYEEQQTLVAAILAIFRGGKF
ncbi:ATP-binding protein [Mesorhizobium sp. 113-1-2]|uniref:ATP-binding protein n=1 Tax=Mesorhizobium sp. 113-1-2 TaxID=2744515 RepID=UPI0019256363|nr:ATP-binding protein [Mesorhizobium sp. 113-1-2]BCG72119.1 ATP-binding protein [Mesorhizobium sp. 113-1-2]